jgi:kinesin light chain
MMVLVGNYISELEGEKLKLRAQVKRLCAENNWLRESLTESQQLLQEAEISLGKLKVDKEHLEFVQNQQEDTSRASSHSHYPHEADLQPQAQELTNGKEGELGN